MNEDMKDVLTVVAWVTIVFALLIFVACDSGWSIAGYEV